MKTTLVLDDCVVERLRARAKEEGVSMSSIVEEAVIRLLACEKSASERGPRRLPSFNSGGYLVDIADRDALHDAMDEL
ncbi:MAG: ribbon-helix-helix protein, CopG family [Candidatus Nanopelagicales bacterium]